METEQKARSDRQRTADSSQGPKRRLGSKAWIEGSKREMGAEDTCRTYERIGGLIICHDSCMRWWRLWILQKGSLVLAGQVT
jgi:hypothetical protein